MRANLNIDLLLGVVLASVEELQLAEHVLPGRSVSIDQELLDDVEVSEMDQFGLRRKTAKYLTVRHSAQGKKSCLACRTARSFTFFSC